MEKNTWFVNCLRVQLYGLKQSPKCWNSTGFVQATGDPCFYVASKGEIFLIAMCFTF